MVHSRGLPSFATVALCRRRQRARLGAWLGWLGAAAVALAYGALTLASDGRNLRPELVGDVLRGLCLLGAGPLALSLASDPAGRDRRDGIELMARVRGETRRGLELARLLAAVQEAALRVALPGLVVCLALAPTTSGWLLLGSALGILVVALIAGVVVGGLGALSGELGAERGRVLFLTVVLVPWVLADLWATPHLSVVGLMDLAVGTLVDLLARVGGFA